MARRYARRYKKRRRTGYGRKKYYRKRYYRRRYSTRAPKRWVRGYGSYSGVEEKPNNDWFVKQADDGWGIEFNANKVREGFHKIFDNPVVNTVAGIADLPTGGLASSTLKVLNRGIDYGINWGETGQLPTLSKKDKKALKKFGSAMGTNFGTDIIKSAKDTYNNFDWGGGEEGWGGQIDPLPTVKKIYKDYKNMKSTWNDYYMNLKNWIPERKIETRLAPQYNIDQYERFWNDREIQQKFKQNKWEKQYRHEFDPIYMNKYK